MARCFVTRSLPGTALERLAEAHEVDVWTAEEPPSRAELHRRASVAEALLSQLTERVDADLLDACPRLAAVSNYAVGVDNVDLAAASERGVPVGHTPGVLTEATADLTWALMLSAARRLPDAERAVRSGGWSWEPDFLLGHDVAGATLGVVGMGRIGSAVARRAQGFEMEVIHTSRTGGVPLDTLLERADFLSLHAPLTAETRGMIGEPELRAMKPTAILVNTARAALVDDAALVEALRDHRIAGAGIDVFLQEPVTAENNPYAGLDNVVLTPHAGAVTREANARSRAMPVDNIIAFLEGRPEHVVNP